MLRKPARRRDTQAVRWWLGVAPLAAIFWTGTAMGAPTILDFEDLAPGTSVTAQYGPRGVLFQNNYLDTDAAAHSGTHVLRTASLAAELFTPLPMVMTFTSPQARVKLFAESTGVALNGTLTAFDASDSVVAQDGPKLVAADEFTTMFEVTDPDTTASITRVELSLENGIYFAIDDLEFEGEPPAPPPPTPPVVKITSPTDGAELDVDTLDIAGTVTGEGLLSSVTLTLSYAMPPESTAPPFTSDLSLTGTGTTRQFSLPGFTGVPLGPITITVTAQNFAAQQGTDSITFTNLPGGIRDRYEAQGGEAVLGAFGFGFFGDGCKIAVYDNGAISDAKFLISGDILTKWLSLKGPLNDEIGWFGCPSGDATSGPGGTTVQSFTRGRIYSNLPGTAYVLSVFVDAISNHGGESAIGIPVADPSDSVGLMQTWLFQQFTRPDHPDLLPSTLEIRGTPPMLWIERQPAESSAENPTTGTLYESFTCSDNLGPCTVTPETGAPITINEPGQFCDFDTYSPITIGGPPEWSAIVGDYVATPIFGVIVSSFYADIDNALTHEFSFGDCKGFPNILAVFAPDCPSDYEFKVQPIGPQPQPIDPETHLPYPSLLGPNNPKNIKIEYEEYYARAAHGFLGFPEKGDLCYATGRWIIDCGHDSYKSELHPLFSFGKMRTVTKITDPSTGLEHDLFGGKPGTRADIWVNGWYPGGDGNAIEMDVYPPPRPTPDSVLHIIKPADFVSGDNVYHPSEGVSLDFAIEPAGAANHVHLKFTAPLRENEVTDAGEMMWEDGRGYWGMWFAYWADN